MIKCTFRQLLVGLALLLVPATVFSSTERTIPPRRYSYPNQLSFPDSLALPDSLRTAPCRGEFDLKTNLLYDLTSTIALGVEYGWGRRLSIDIAANYNPWTFSEGRKWKHWLVQPELRIWTKDRQQGHFLGIHALGGVYNVNKIYLPYRYFPQTNSLRHEGWAVGGGISYGYRWNFSDRWGMEGEVGFGYVYTQFDRFCPVKCGVRTSTGSHHYFGPTRVNLNLIYRFGAKRRALQRMADTEAIERYYRGLARRDTVVCHTTTVVRDTVVIRDTVRLEGKRASEQHDERLSLFLEFSAGQSALRPDFRNNASELQSLNELMTRISRDTTISIETIRIIGYCSIEGTVALNDRLSYNRARSVATYLKERYPSLSDKFHIDGAGEDWAGLLHELEQVPSLESKDQIEYIIRNVGIFEGRERRLMDLSGGRPYRWMAKTIFPRLRRIECIIRYTVNK